jgi:hypothetical protein
VEKSKKTVEKNKGKVNIFTESKLSINFSSRPKQFVAQFLFLQTQRRRDAEVYFLNTESAEQTENKREADLPDLSDC